MKWNEVREAENPVRKIQDKFHIHIYVLRTEVEKCPTLLLRIKYASASCVINVVQKKRHEICTECVIKLAAHQCPQEGLQLLFPYKFHMSLYRALGDQDYLTTQRFLGIQIRGWVERQIGSYRHILQWVDDGNFAS